MIKRIFSSWEEICWFALIILLPFTSLPIVSRLVGGTMVSPPSLLILLLLVLTWLIPTIIKRTHLPSQIIPLLFFILAALISMLSAAFIRIPTFRNVSLWQNEFSTFITLLIGVLFYILSASYPLDHGRVNRWLKWINWSGVVILAWSALQAVFWFANSAYPGWFYQIQSLVSVSQRLYPGRVTGLAYEPSWLAHQLNMLYLPLWLAATVKKSSAHRFRLIGITIENILLVCGVVILVLSISRVGLLAFLLTVAYLLFLANRRLVAWLCSKVEKLWHMSATKVLTRSLLTLGMYGLLIITYLAIFFSAAKIISRHDPRMAEFLNPTSYMGSAAQIANRLHFAERVIFWQAGWEVFTDHPWLGVGLGNTGFFFLEKMPAYGWSMPEISNLIYQSDIIPNTKSLWIRLLSETGVVGFSIFISWLYLLWQTTRHNLADKNKQIAMWGLAAQFGLIALVIEGFSVDTFALPYFWLLFGWMTASSRLVLEPAPISELG